MIFDLVDELGVVETDGESVVVNTTGCCNVRRRKIRQQLAIDGDADN